MAELGKGQFVVQKRTVLGSQAEDRFAPCLGQQADLSVQLQQVRVVRRVGQLVRAFHFQNSYGIDGRTPNQHEVQMGLYGHALVLPSDFQLWQHIQAQGRQRLPHTGFKPVAPLQDQQTLQAVSRGQHLSGQGGTRALPVLADVAHAHIGGAVAQVGGGVMLRNRLQPEVGSKNWTVS